MSQGLRRTLLGVGAVLLVGGWGMTKYVDAAQTALADGRTAVVTAWVGKKTKPASYAKKGMLSGRLIYLSGVVGMTIGAALVVGAFPKGSWQSGP